MEKIALVLSDHQARFNDPYTEEAVLKFEEDLHPDVVFLAGDVFDFAALSTYRKTLFEEASLQTDLDAGRGVLARQRQTNPGSRIVLIEGNHEERLTRYLLDKAPALAESVELSIPNFLRVGDYGVEYVGPYGMGEEWHGLFIHHGTRVRGESAFSAKAEYLEAGTSGVSGHTHRLGSYYYTDRTGPHAWYENGCMCNVGCRCHPKAQRPPDARGPRVRNNQQGFTVIFYDPMAGQWNAYQIAIVNHQFIWGGNLYRP